jgi:hypothetical protein
VNTLISRELADLFWQPFIAMSTFYTNLADGPTCSNARRYFASFGRSLEVIVCTSLYLRFGILGGLLEVAAGRHVPLVTDARVYFLAMDGHNLG